MRRTLSLALLAALALGTAQVPNAEAVRGRLYMSGSIERDKKTGKVAYKEKANSARGMRSRLTGGLLGRSIKTKTTISGGTIETGAQIRSSRRDSQSTMAADGASSTVVSTSKRAFGRPSQVQTDVVSSTAVHSTIEKRGFFRSGRAVRSREQVNNQAGLIETGNGPARATANPASRVGRGRMKFDRMVRASGNGMTVTDTAQRHILNKRKVTLTETQTANSRTTVLKGPRARFTSNTPKFEVERTSVHESPTRVVSNSVVRRRGKVTSQDTVVADDARGVAAQNLRVFRRTGNRSPRMDIVTSAYENGTRVERVTAYRRDGSVRSVTSTVTSDREGARFAKNRTAIRVGYRRDGSVRTKLGWGKVDGKRVFAIGNGTAEKGTAAQADMIDDAAGQPTLALAGQPAATPPPTVAPRATTPPPAAGRAAAPSVPYREIAPSVHLALLKQDLPNLVKAEAEAHGEFDRATDRFQQAEAMPIGSSANAAQARQAKATLVGQRRLAMNEARRARNHAVARRMQTESAIDNLSKELGLPRRAAGAAPTAAPTTYTPRRAQ